MREKKESNRELTVKSRTENLSAIRDFINFYAHEAGIGNEAVENIMLAVDEACTNIIKHAYKSFPNGEIKIKIEYDDKKFTIIIIDYGNAFDPGKISKPDLQKYYRERKIGGLGMYLIKTLMDDVEYTSVPGKFNRVLLTKNIR